MADLLAIKNDIIDARLTTEELTTLNRFIVDELKLARSRQARQNIQTLEPGQRAKVVGKLKGDAYLNQTGEIVRVNRTRVVMTFNSDPRQVAIPASVLAPTDE